MTASRAIAWAAGALAAIASAVLAVSGVWLSLNYAPRAPGVPDSELRPALRTIGDVTQAHRAAAWILAVALLVLLVSALSRANRTSTIRMAVGTTIATLAFVGAAWTGGQLAWKQIGLWTVRVGDDFEGLRGMFSDDVRFYVVPFGEVEPNTFQLLALAHLALLPLVLAAGLAVALLRRSGSSATEEPSMPSPERPTEATTT